MSYLNEDPLGAPLNVRTLPNIIWSVIQRIWVNKNLEFTQDSAKDRAIKGPRIAWKIVRRVPGRGGIGTRKPSPREYKVEPDLSNLKDRWAQWFTTIYQFDIYDLSNKDVDNLTTEFETLMFSLGGELKRFGVDEFLFDEELEDELLKPKDTKNQIYVRSLRYLCILETPYIKVTPILKQAWIRIFGAKNYAFDIPITRSASGNIDTLPNLWLDQVFNIDNYPTHNVYASGDYVYGVDFTLTGDPNTGVGYINWISGGISPLPGSIYYVTYTYYDQQGQPIPETPANVFPWIDPLNNPQQ